VEFYQQRQKLFLGYIPFSRKYHHTLATMDSCEDDFDCPNSKVCYAGAEWAPSNSSFCDCDGFYGWKGENCEKAGPQTFFWIFSNFGLVIFCSYNLYRYGIPGFRGLNERELSIRTFSSMVQTFTILNCYFIVQTLAALAFIVDVVDSDMHGEAFSPLGVSPRKKGHWFLFWSVMSAIAFLCYFMASLNIALVWVDVAFKAKRLQTKSHGMVRFRVLTRLFQVFGVGVYGFGASVDPFHVWLIVAILSFILGAVYTFARRWILGISFNLNSRTQVNSRSANIFKEAFDNIRRTSILVTLCLYANFVIGLAITVWTLTVPTIYPSIERQLMLPAQVNTYGVITQLVSYIFTFSGMIIAQYLDVILSSRGITTEENRESGGASVSLTMATRNIKVINNEDAFNLDSTIQRSNTDVSNLL